MKKGCLPCHRKVEPKRHSIFMSSTRAPPMKFNSALTKRCTCISVALPRLPFPPSWSSHCQSTPRTTRAPGKIPLAVIFLLLRRGSRRTLRKENYTQYYIHKKHIPALLLFYSVRLKSSNGFDNIQNRQWQVTQVA